jgi:hypothetical protein
MKAIHSIGMLTIIVLASSSLLGCSNQGDAKENSAKTALKTETIRAKGKYGTLQEERVKAMYSETQYIPTGSSQGYRIIDSSLADPKENAYRNPEKLLIPSFTVKTW